MTTRSSAQQAILEARLALLQEKDLPSDTAYMVLNALGDDEFVEARDVIASYLTNADPNLRGIALHVLVEDFFLPEYLDTALRFLDDPDPNLQATAASVLATLRKNSDDQRVLAALARAVRDEERSRFTRAAIYIAMRTVHHFDPDEYFALGFKAIEQMPVDWAWVDSYLRDGGAANSR